MVLTPGPEEKVRGHSAWRTAPAGSEPRRPVPLSTAQNSERDRAGCKSLEDRIKILTKGRVREEAGMDKEPRTIAVWYLWWGERNKSSKLKMYRFERYYFYLVTKKM